MTIEPVAIPARNVFQRLSDARAEFHTLKLKKTGHNKFAGYYYFELADFLIPALQVFSRHGLLGIVSFKPEIAEMKIINMHDKDDFYVINSPMSSAALKGCHEVQNLGAVQTYLRRYLWVAALEIVEHDAIDSSKPISVDSNGQDGAERFSTDTKVKATKITPMEAAKDEAVQKLLDDPQEFEYLQNLAAELVQLAEIEKKPELAYIHAQKHTLTNDEKLALWDILKPNSKTRAAIKNKPVNLAEVA